MAALLGWNVWPTWTSCDFFKLAQCGGSVLGEKSLVLCSELFKNPLTETGQLVWKQLWPSGPWVMSENITFSPSFLKAVRISIFCCVCTSRDSFPTIKSRSICKECSQWGRDRRRDVIDTDSPFRALVRLGCSGSWLEKLKAHSSQESMKQSRLQAWKVTAEWVRSNLGQPGSQLSWLLLGKQSDHLGGFESLADGGLDCLIGTETSGRGDKWNLKKKILSK